MFISSFVRCNCIFWSLLQTVDILHNISHVRVPEILRHIITVWKIYKCTYTSNVFASQNLSKSCINDRNLKRAAKEVTSWSQFFQRKNKRIEGQKLNGLKMNLRILILNSSKLKSRDLFNFRFLPLTSNKFWNLFSQWTMIFLVTETCPFAHEEIRDSHRKT